MKTELSSSESRQFNDITKFNQSIEREGWSLKRKIIKQKKLDHLKVHNSTWHDVDITRCSLTEASFKKCTFEKVTLEDSDLSNARFEGCAFVACVFKDVKMMDGKYASCVFKQCTIESSNFSGTSPVDTSFHDLKAVEVEWRHAEFQNDKFEDCDLKEVDITDGKLTGTSFKNCKLLRSGFSSNLINDCSFDIQGDFVSFAESRLTDITISSKASINDLNLAGITGSNILVKNLEWSEMFSISLAQVKKFRLQNARLRYSSITGTKLTDAVFENVQFAYARFDRSTCLKTRFENIIFSGEIIFDSTGFKDTEFSNIRRGDDLKASFKNTVYENNPPF